MHLRSIATAMLASLALASGVARAAEPASSDDRQGALRPGETRVMGGGASRFTGAPISLDFKDADVVDVLRFLAEFGRFNLVLDASVGGRITIKLDSVPWDQALDVILRNNSLAVDMEGHVIRVAGTAVLTREEDARRRLVEEQALAGPLVTTTQALSYAKAADVAKLVEKLLSPRGSVVVDKRTNTLVITEIAVRSSGISRQIEALDRP